VGFYQQALNEIVCLAQCSQLALEIGEYDLRAQSMAFERAGDGRADGPSPARSVTQYLRTGTAPGCLSVPFGKLVPMVAEPVSRLADRGPLCAGLLGASAIALVVTRQKV
jgi:hypothetical protein